MLEVMKQISELLKIEDIRIWTITNRYNNTVRPLNCIDMKENGNKAVSEISKQDSSWTIFVETCCDLSFSNTFDYLALLNTTPSNLVDYKPPSPQKLPPFDSKTDVMIFFKFYDPKTSSLRYVFRMHLSITSTLSKHA